MDRQHTDQLSAATVPIGVAGNLVRAARLAPTHVQLDAARAALAELAAAKSILESMLGK